MARIQRIRVRGEFPRSRSDQFISNDVVAACRKYRPSGYGALPKILAVDVACFGDDQTVIGTARDVCAGWLNWPSSPRKLHTFIAVQAMSIERNSAVPERHSCGIFEQRTTFSPPTTTGAPTGRKLEDLPDSDKLARARAVTPTRGLVVVNGLPQFL